MTWVFDDGGREAAGFRGNAGDCVVRAIAIATGLPYRQVYDALSDLNASRRKNPERSARNGSYRREYQTLMEQLGWEWTPTMRVGSGCTTHLRADELPPGRIVARLSRHTSAVIDGVIHDTFDPSRDGTRCVYGYFAPGPSAAAPGDHRQPPATPGAATDRPHEATVTTDREEDSPMTETIEAPPVAEDVTGQQPESAPSPKDLHKSLVKELRSWKGDAKATLTEKTAYHRVEVGGKTVMYLHKPTKKSVRVEFPRGNGGYDRATITTTDDVTAALKRVQELVAAAAPAPAEAS